MVVPAAVMVELAPFVPSFAVTFNCVKPLKPATLDAVFATTCWPDTILSVWMLETVAAIVVTAAGLTALPPSDRVSVLPVLPAGALMLSPAV